jgi:hypothetical protein
MPSRIPFCCTRKGHEDVRIGLERDYVAAKADKVTKRLGILACIGANIEHAIDREGSQKSLERQYLGILVHASDNRQASCQPAIGQFPSKPSFRHRAARAAMAAS